MPIEKRIQDITDEKRVFTQPEELEFYSRDSGFTPAIRPRCVVLPETTEEILKIVAIANETGTPIVPVSSGKPHFNGGTVPGIGGAIVVDLMTMNKIVRVDPKNKVAMVEPGVTFIQLIDELKDHGLMPFMPLSPRLTKSVLTSYVEREPITTPRDQWDTQDPLLCTELVYGSGDLFRTGSAAGPGTKEEQWETGRAMMRGYGPTQTDFGKLSMAAQGTMGIITWATIKCRRTPAFIEPLLVATDDLQSLIDLTYKTLWRRIGNQMMIVNRFTLASLLGSDREQIESNKKSLPAWILICGFEGSGKRPEERVAWQKNVFEKDAADRQLKVESQVGDFTASDVLRAASIPSSEPFWKFRHQSANKSIFFVTTLDQTPGFIDRMNSLVKLKRLAEDDIGVYLQPTVQGTNCHCEFNLPFNPDDNQQKNQVQTLSLEAAKSLTEMGGLFSRPYGEWTQVAFGRDVATVNALRKLKKIFDPNGIMNPGKLCF